MCAPSRAEEDDDDAERTTPRRAPRFFLQVGTPVEISLSSSPIFEVCSKRPGV
jgi:hypothetical protein